MIFCSFCGTRAHKGPCKSPTKATSYERAETIAHYLLQGGSRKVAAEELRRLGLMMRGEALEVLAAKHPEAAAWPVTPEERAKASILDEKVPSDAHLGEGYV